MLKQQVTGNQNKGKFGQGFLAALSFLNSLPHGCCWGVRMSNDLREQAGWKEQEERCIHGISEVMAQLWLSRELYS